MTGAVIDLPQDISDLIPSLEKIVNGYSYDLHDPSVDFRCEEWSVIIEKDRVTVYGAFEEVTAHKVMDWLI